MVPLYLRYLMMYDIAPFIHREKKETRNCNADNIIDLTLESDPETENGTEIANGRLEEDTSSVGRKFSSSSFEYMIKRLKNGANNEKQSKCEQLSPEKGMILIILCFFCVYFNLFTFRIFQRVVVLACH